MKKNLDPILHEFDQQIPEIIKKPISESRKLIDPSRAGIKKACHELQFEIEKAINMLPAGSLLASILIGGFTVGALALGVAVYLLNTNSVEIIVKNQNCPTIEPLAIAIPIQLPGFKLFSESIDPGKQGIVKIYPISFEVNLNRSVSGNLKIGNISIPVSLSSAISGLKFDGVSLMGSRTSIDLATRKQHELVVSCR